MKPKTGRGASKNNRKAAKGGVDLDPLYQLMSEQPLVWGKHYFPHHFRMESPSFHHTLINAAMGHKFLAVGAPRESAKSTILVFLYAFHQIMFKKKRFILIISNTFKKGSMHLDAIKKELRDNEKLQKDFSGIEITKDAEGDSIIRHPDGFETKVLCKGVDQIGSIRGVKFGAYRPDLIMGDDMEDDELVKNPQRRSELKDQYDEALIPAGERGNCQYLIVGTVLHDDCQVAKLLGEKHYPEYHKILFRAHIDPDGANEDSLWPEKWTVADLRHMRKVKPNVYAKEMQNDPVAGLNVRFSKDMFRYWRQQGDSVVLYDAEGEIKSKYDFRDCKAGIACDLAWESKRSDDYTAIVSGLLTPASDILVYSVLAEKGYRPNQLQEYLFTHANTLQALTGSVVPIGFEKGKLEKVNKWLLRRAMEERGEALLVKDLVWDGDKVERVEIRLQPRYIQHMIYHLKGMGDLEHQLERFPYGTNDDIVDGLQGLVQLLQHPKKKKVEKKDDLFMKLRQTVIDKKKGETFHGFGKKIQMRGIPFRRSFF